MEWLLDQLTTYNVASSLLGILGILSSMGIARSRKLLREEVEDIIQEVKEASSPDSPGGSEVTKEELGAVADFFLFWKGRE